MHANESKRFHEAVAAFDRDAGLAPDRGTPPTDEEREALKRKIERLTAADEAAASDDRPTIEVHDGELAATGAAVVERLTECAFFRRGGEVRRVLTLADPEMRGTDVVLGAGEVVAKKATVAMVQGDISRVATVVRWDARRKAFGPTTLPAAVAQYVLDCGAELGLRPVAGVTYLPLMDDGGDLTFDRGYHADTGLIMAGTVDWLRLPMPAAPTLADAHAAIDWLCSEVYVDFPFAGEIDRSVAITALLTGLARASMPCAPLIGFSASQWGAGKSMLAEVVAIACTGRRAAMRSAGHDDAELSKRVATAIMAGTPVNVVDNISQPLGGDELAATLTSSTVSIRVFGTTEEQVVESRALWLATGVNLTLKGDLVRRALRCVIETGTDRPQERSGFRHPALLDWCIEHRLEIVAAGLIVLRAYALAGRPPHGGAPLGSFEVWDRVVRGAVIWAGLPDPVESQRGLEGEDPAHRAFVGVFEALRERFGTSEWRVRDVRRIEDAVSAYRRSPMNAPEPSAADRALVDSLADYSHGRGAATFITYWIRSHKNRPCGRWVLREGIPDTHQKTVANRFERYGFAGDSGG
jgi:hypothetical protein